MATGTQQQQQPRNGAIAPPPPPAAAAAATGNAALLETVLVSGDLGALSPPQRVRYYQQVCESLGLNPLTRPFEYLRLQGRVVLYATRNATDQLRALRGISIEIVSRETSDGVEIVTVRATTPDGRHDEEIGAVPTKGLSGEGLCNAILKSITKAKRRVTLSICGLGWLDETEVETIPQAERLLVRESGELVAASSATATATGAATTATPPPARAAAPARERPGAWPVAAAAAAAPPPRATGAPDDDDDDDGVPGAPSGQRPSRRTPRTLQEWRDAYAALTRRAMELDIDYVPAQEFNDIEEIKQAGARLRAAIEDASRDKPAPAADEDEEEDEEAGR